MKEVYIDIMEKSLSAYTDERIRDYIDEVKLRGLKEHGFPRLTADIGILISFGRRSELLPVFLEMMDICCEQMPRVKAANDFTVREICCLLMLLEERKTVNNDLIFKWKKAMAGFEPWECYTCIAKTPDTPTGNWAAFAGVSDFIRGKYCGIDTSKFVDWEISSQMMSFDENGMYKDPNNPMVYDFVTRLLMSVLLHFGYNGRFKEKIKENLCKSADLTQKMQSVTGEIPFGGRSNQFINNEAHFACVCEYYASFFNKKGDADKAGEFKAAAKMAQEAIIRWLDSEPKSHIKNKYAIDSQIGCEGYGYFNKYMITVASFAYVAYLLADDSIEPTAAVAEKGGYIAGTGEDFHKIFLNCGGYFAEIDTDADFHYDANGLGRIQKKGCHSALCLSVPFPAGDIKYKTEKENMRPMSICCYVKKDGITFYGSESYARYKLKSYCESPELVEAEIECKISEDICITHKYVVGADGVEMSLSGYDNCGFMLPAFAFDGNKASEILTDKDSITVKFGGNTCKYIFDGEIQDEPQMYYNRNGRYKVFAIDAKKVKIEIN